MYVCHVLTGREKDVARMLNELGFQSIVPEETSILRRHHEHIEVRRIMMPGYVFFTTPIMNKAKYYAVKGIAGVIRLLNYDNPMTDKEASIIHRLNSSSDVVKLTRQDDGNYKIISGALRGLEGQIVKVHKRQHKLTMCIMICGKETEVTLSALLQ